MPPLTPPLRLVSGRSPRRSDYPERNRWPRCPRRSASAKPSPNATPLTAGERRTAACDSRPSTLSNHGSPTSGGQARHTAFPVTPPTLSPDALRARVSPPAIRSPAAASSTANGCGRASAAISAAGSAENGRSSIPGTAGDMRRRSQCPCRRSAGSSKRRPPPRPLP